MTSQGKKKASQPARRRGSTIKEDATGQTVRRRELVSRTEGTTNQIIIPLKPGVTGARVLDTLSGAYAWSKFNANPKVHLVSLTQPGTSTVQNGVWYTRIIHDATYEQVVTNQENFMFCSAAFTSHKATSSFTLSVPTTSTRLSPYSDRHSWVIFVHSGPATDKAEIYLDYHVSFGGVGGEPRTPVNLEVKDGKFVGPDGSPLSDIPTLNAPTIYKFYPPLKHDQASSFAHIIPATPIQVARADNKPLVTDEAEVSQIAVTKPRDVVKDAVRDELKHTAVTVLQEGGKVVRAQVKDSFSKWSQVLLARRNQNVSTSDTHKNRDTPQSAFDTYTGHVVLERYIPSNDDYRNVQSIVPLRLSDVESQNSRGFETILGDVAATLATEVIFGIIHSIKEKAASQTAIVHKGPHALQFLANPLPLSMVDPDDPNPENPLPELPDFGNDPEAPGSNINWLGTRVLLNGYVADNNGTPEIYWLAGRDLKTDAPHFSCPQPHYYVNHRFPWDHETKRKLATSIEVSELLEGAYLYLEGYVWGDDGIVSFNPNLPGAVYIGTVAHFAGISMSRSLIKVLSKPLLSAFKETILIGQNKRSYRRADPGRVSMFSIMLGAVADGEVAQSFLANWTIDRSITNMVNEPMKKGIGVLPQVPVTPHTDFSYNTRNTFKPNPNLDLMSPSIYGRLAPRDRETTPIVLEAGPVRVLFGARWNNADGWWQHVPYYMWTKTDISAKWLVDFKLNAENYQHTNDQPHTDLIKITAPSRLQSGAYMCVEVITTQGVFINIIGKSTTVAKLANEVHGPIYRWRAVFDASSPITLVACYEDSRPCDAVEGYDDDMYVTGCATAWLLKDLDAAKAWVLYRSTTENTITNTKYITTVYNIRKSGDLFMLTSTDSTGDSYLGDTINSSGQKLFALRGWSETPIPRAQIANCQRRYEFYTAGFGGEEEKEGEAPHDSKFGETIGLDGVEACA